MTTKAQQAEQEEARATLRELLPPGTTVYTVLRHVSRSGMSRDIDLYVMQCDSYDDGSQIGETAAPRWISSLAAKAAGFTRRKGKDAITVGGCGMDMGFELVYQLSRKLYSGGFGCIGAGCPSNDHSNGDRDYTPHVIQYTAEDCPGQPCGDCCDHKSGPGRDHWHRDGGYALKRRWL